MLPPHAGLLIYNPTGIPIFELLNALTGNYLGAVWLEMRRPAPTMVPAPTPDTLALARWQIMRITGTPTAAAGVVVWAM